MSSIKTITYLLWRRIEGGDIPQTSRYTYKELREYAVSGLLESLKANYYEQLNSNEYRYGSDDITTTTTQQVKVDEVTGLQYVDVPLQTIKVAGNRMLSITSNNPVAVTAVRYVPVRREEVFVINLQPPVPCVVPYYREDNKAFFFGAKVDEKSLKVNQKYTVPTDDDAELTLPESEGAIIERALRLLGQQFASDRSNDGVPPNGIPS